MGFLTERGKLKVGPLGADGSEEPDASLVNIQNYSPQRFVFQVNNTSSSIKYWSMYSSESQV